MTTDAGRGDLAPLRAEGPTCADLEVAFAMSGVLTAGPGTRFACTRDPIRPAKTTPRPPGERTYAVLDKHPATHGPTVVTRPAPSPRCHVNKHLPPTIQEDAAMHYLQSAARRSLPAMLAAAAACALTSWVSTGTARAGPVTPDNPGPAHYLGTWNYDQPDRASMRNIAVIQCPVTSTNCTGPGPAGGPLQIPQIGDIVFTQTAGGVVGHTDQGCTWQFAARPGSLELARPSENCFNQVIGSSYTITRWSVTVHGNHEQETITAVSHLPAGDYDFVLANGSRTRTPEKGRPAAVRQFLGPWEYTPADPQTLVNIVTSQATGPDGVHVR